MKYSGTKWLGNIPQNWKISKISSIYTQRKTKVNDRDYPPLSVTMQGIVPQLETAAKSDAHDDRKLVKKGDFAINSRSDRRGSCGISDLDGSVSLINIVMQPKDEMHPGYYNWLFHTTQFADEFYKWGHGIVDDLWTTNWQDMKHIDIPVPALGTQEKISNYLDKKVSEIDSLYSDIEKQIKKLDEYKMSKIKEIFDSFLERYDYVYGKLGHLSNLVTKQTGFDYTNTISPSLVGELTDETIPYLQTRHFKDNYFNFETEYYIPKNIAKLFPNIILNKKCLLFSIVGASIGNVAVYPGTQTSFLGGAICKVNLNDEKLYDYVKHYMMSIYGQDQIKIKVNSSAQGTITVQNVRDFKIPLFKDKELFSTISNKINILSEKMNDIINKKSQQLDILDQYKKSLIYEYVTGKKEVPSTY